MDNTKTMYVSSVVKSKDSVGKMATTPRKKFKNFWKNKKILQKLVEYSGKLNIYYGIK